MDARHCSACGATPRDARLRRSDLLVENGFVCRDAYACTARQLHRTAVRRQQLISADDAPELLAIDRAVRRQQLISAGRIEPSKFEIPPRALRELEDQVFGEAA